MKRPLSDQRPVGPFAQMGDNCTITFAATFRVREASTFEDLADEAVDNIKARINTRFEESFDREPVTKVTWQRLKSGNHKLFVNTSLRRVTSQMEDIMLEEIKAEVERLTDSKIQRQGYEFIA